ncbi:MAG: type IV pilus assembly protein PilX [Pseudohongiellaceae bacterium]|jgi:type IV pilus assembly protein PilX
MRNMRPQPSFTRHKRQKGAILIFCLIFLTVLTMMGVSSMESATLEERMSGNMRDYTVAFQSAESAIKAAEAWLVVQGNLPLVSSDGSTTVWAENSMDASAEDGKYWWEHANADWEWWMTNGVAITDVAEVSQQPRYIIEEYRSVDSGQSISIGGGGPTEPRVFHRLTARGVGINPTTSVSVQTTFVQTYD